MAATTGTMGDVFSSVRDGVLRIEYLYVLMLFPVIYVIFESNFYHVTILAMTAVLCVHVLVSNRIRVSNDFLVAVLLYLMFLGYAAVTMLWSPSSEYAAFKFVRLASVCLLLVVAPAVLFASSERFHNLFGFSMYAGAFVAALVTIGYLHPGYSRSFHLIGSDSHLAPGRMIGFGLLVAVYYLISSGREPQRYTYGLLMAAMFVGLTVSESRGPLVAALISLGLLVVLVLYVDRGRKLEAFGFVLAAAALFGFLFVLHTVFGVSIPNFDRIIPLLRGELDASNVARLEFYYQGYLLWLQSPVFGSGFGSYGHWYFGTDTRGFPHNFVLEILSELGIVGLSMFVALLAVAVRPLATNSREHPMGLLLFSLLVYGLINASFSQDLQGDRIIFASIGLAVCLGLFDNPDPTARETD